MLRYDDGPYVVLQDLIDLQKYIAQNESPDVCRRRQVRMSLRALEGQTVHWPYDHISVSAPSCHTAAGLISYTAYRRALPFIMGQREVYNSFICALRDVQAEH